MEHGDTVTVEVEATVIEVFDNGFVDVNLNDHGTATLGGINLQIPRSKLSKKNGVSTVTGPTHPEHDIEFPDGRPDDIEYEFWRCETAPHVFAVYHGEGWVSPWKCPYCGDEEISKIDVDGDYLGGGPGAFKDRNPDAEELFKGGDCDV